MPALRSISLAASWSITCTSFDKSRHFSRVRRASRTRKPVIRQSHRTGIALLRLGWNSCLNTRWKMDRMSRERDSQMEALLITEKAILSSITGKLTNSLCRKVDSRERRATTRIPIVFHPIIERSRLHFGVRAIDTVRQAISKHPLSSLLYRVHRHLWRRISCWPTGISIRVFVTFY